MELYHNPKRKSVLLKHFCQWETIAQAKMNAQNTIIPIKYSKYKDTGLKLKWKQQIGLSQCKNLEITR